MIRKEVKIYKAGEIIQGDLSAFLGDLQGTMKAIGDEEVNRVIQNNETAKKVLDLMKIEILPDPIVITSELASEIAYAEATMDPENDDEQKRRKIRRVLLSYSPSSTVVQQSRILDRLERVRENGVTAEEAHLLAIKDKELKNYQNDIVKKVNEARAKDLKKGAPENDLI